MGWVFFSPYFFLEHKIIRLLCLGAVTIWRRSFVRPPSTVRIIYYTAYTTTTCLSTYLHTWTWNLIFFFFCSSSKNTWRTIDVSCSATTDPAYIIQYSIMCLVTVHQRSRRVRGGHCSYGEYRFIASPSSVFSE